MMNWEYPSYIHQNEDDNIEKETGDHYEYFIFSNIEQSGMCGHYRDYWNQGGSR